MQHSSQPPFLVQGPLVRRFPHAPAPGVLDPTVNEAFRGNQLGDNGEQLPDPFTTPFANDYSWGDHPLYTTISPATLAANTMRLTTPRTSAAQASSRSSVSLSMCPNAAATDTRKTFAMDHRISPNSAPKLMIKTPYGSCAWTWQCAVPQRASCHRPSKCQE